MIAESGRARPFSQKDLRFQPESTRNTCICVYVDMQCPKDIYSLAHTKRIPVNAKHAGKQYLFIQYENQTNLMHQTFHSALAQRGQCLWAPPGYPIGYCTRGPHLLLQWSEGYGLPSPPVIMVMFCFEWDVPLNTLLGLTRWDCFFSSELPSFDCPRWLS